MVERGLYEASFDEQGSSGSAVRLVERTAPRGVVLDIGCGYGHVAERVRDGGRTYVGLDIDPRAIENLTARGFEAGHLDLRVPADELAARLEVVLGDRSLSAVLALDVLEHLVDPLRCLQAITDVARRRGVPELIVSLPNVTHVEVAAKLLLGRWEMLPIGLLDRTHLQFFDEGRCTALLAAAGWDLIDADDVVALFTEQNTLPDAPPLRANTPLRDALEVIRHRGGPHGHTYQFVRRYGLTAAAPTREVVDEPPTTGEGPLLVVVLDEVAASDERLLDSLAAQGDRDFVIVGHNAGEVAGHVGVPAQEASAGELVAAVRATGARYVSVVAAGTVLGTHFVRALRDMVEAAPGRVVTSACAVGSLDGPALPIAPLELLGPRPSGSVVPAAYALPVGALSQLGPLGPTLQDLVVTLARGVMWCGRADGHVATVVVDPAAVVELDALLGDVVAELDREPVIHGAGALAPIVATGLELEQNQVRVAELEQELAELAMRHEVLARARDEDVAELHQRVARLSTPWGALSFTAKRWTTAFFRLLGRGLGRRGRRP